MDTSRRSLTAISKKCETISKAMTKAGKRLTTHVTAPITALGHCRREGVRGL